MITEYRRNQCEYKMGNLKPLVYLLPKDTTRILYTIDDHDGKVSQIYATQCIKMETVSTKLEVTESIDTRLNFDSTVTVGLREKWGETWSVLLNRMRFQDYYVVIEDNMGSQFIQSPEFTSQFTYTYNFNTSSNNSHNAEIKFKCSSNNPALYVEQNVYGTETIGQDCIYQDGGVTGFWMTPYNYAFVDANADGKFTTITCTGGEAMHQVDFDPQSFQFRQQYDGRSYQERLTFTIPFEKFKHYWRYNLVEFTQNRYAIAFNTTQGNYIAAGFEFGFEPTYTIETTDDVNEMNRITITLNHLGQNSILYCSDREPEFIDSTTDIFVPVTQPIKDPVTGRSLAYYHCISKSEAIYTLIQMCTETMIPTDRYMCLEGYETTYQNLNIVGTYGRDADFGFPLIFENYDCSYKDNCKLEYMPKTVYTFAYAGQSFTTPVLGPCPWEIHSLPDWITCDITEGQGGISYNVTFTCTIDGTPTPVTATAYIQSFDNVGLIQFICQKEPDWYKPYVHNITAEKQTVTTFIYEGYDDYTVCEIPEELTYKKIYGTRKLEIYVPENPDPNNGRQFKVKLCSPYHEDGYITINQDIIYYEWREVTGEYLCENGNSYKKLRRYKGYTADNITIWTGEQRTGSLLVENDPRCDTSGGGDGEEYVYEWIDGYTSCQGHDLYEAQRKRESHDGGSTWEWTEEYQLGNLIEENSDQCAGQSTEKQYKMIIDESLYECGDGNDHNSYYMECQWYSYNGRDWFKVVDPSTVCQRSQTIRKENDPDCGAPIDDPTKNYRWIVTDGYICIDGDKWSKLRLQVSNDGGITWTDTTTYKQNQLIEAESPDCDDSDTPEYGWVFWEGKKICQGVDSYTAERYAYTFDGGRTWYVTEPEEYRPYQLLMQNDPDCGYNPGATYRWNTETGETLCNDGNLYKRVDYEVSYDQGETWQKTGQSRIGELIEYDSEQCQDVQVQYEYRLGSDYECDGCDSYYLFHRWESQDGGQTWYESDPEVTSRSNTIRLENDPECGCSTPVEPQYRWVRTDQTMCVGYDLYWIEKQQISTDGGSNWNDMVPSVTQRGDLIRRNSEQCGYTPEIIYDWRIDNTRWTCVNTDSYYIEVRYESLDNGTTWVKSNPEVTRPSSTIHLANDPECGYTPETSYRWVDDGDNFICLSDGQEDVITWVDVSGEWVCVGTVAYNKQRKYVNNIPQDEYRTGETRVNVLDFETNSDCQNDIVWVDTNNSVCSQSKGVWQKCKQYQKYHGISGTVYSPAEYKYDTCTSSSEWETEQDCIDEIYYTQTEGYICEESDIEDAWRRYYKLQKYKGTNNTPVTPAVYKKGAFNASASQYPSFRSNPQWVWETEQDCLNNTYYVLSDEVVCYQPFTVNCSTCNNKSLYMKFHVTLSQANNKFWPFYYNWFDVEDFTQYITCTNESTSDTYTPYKENLWAEHTQWRYYYNLPAGSYTFEVCVDDVRLFNNVSYNHITNTPLFFKDLPELTRIDYYVMNGFAILTISIVNDGDSGKETYDFCLAKNCANLTTATNIFLRLYGNNYEYYNGNDHNPDVQVMFIDCNSLSSVSNVELDKRAGGHGHQFIAMGCPNLSINGQRRNAYNSTWNNSKLYSC